jgi:hypothetical protein
MNGIEVQAPTIRSCAGFNDLYRKSFYIPLWSDHIIETDELNWRSVSSAADPELLPLTEHFPAQFPNAFPNSHHVKFQTPWAFTCDEDISFQLSTPVWNQKGDVHNLTVIPGLLEFKHQSATHVNTLVPRKVNRIELDAGSPLCMITPLTERRVVIKNHLVRYEEYARISVKNDYTSTFRNKYKKGKKFSENASKSKCPFHRG